MRGISQLKQFNLAYDILIFPKQLPAAVELVRRFPDQRYVLDHIAKPRISEKVLSPWQEQIRELAKAPNLCCKVSGLVNEAKHGQWRKEDFRPFLDVVFAVFGEDRLLFGSYPMSSVRSSLSGKANNFVPCATGAALVLKSGTCLLASATGAKAAF